MNNHGEEKPDAGKHALIGATVGAAGIAQTVAFTGTAILAVMPVFIVLGAIGGLVCWGVRTIAGEKR
jgi:hypothetical protein